MGIVGNVGTYRTVIYNLVIFFRYSDVKDIDRLREGMLEYLTMESMKENLPISVYVSNMYGVEGQSIAKIEWMLLMELKIEDKEEEFNYIVRLVLHNLIKEKVQKYLEDNKYESSSGVNVVIHHGPLVKTLSTLIKDSSLLITDQLNCFSENKE